MKIRRIVTGHDPQGGAVFVSDGDTPRAVAFRHIPGHAVAQVWATSPDTCLPYTGDDPTVPGGTLVPGPGGTSLLYITFPPDAAMMAMDPDLAGPELGAALPGLIERFEQDCPGMHMTDSIDYGIVLDGEIWLELDNGAVKQVRKGDVVIQNGTRHAWRNRSDKPATMLFVLVGVNRGE